MNPAQDALQAWVGRSETHHDTLHAAPVAALSATLDHADASIAAGSGLPPLWHWLYFLPMHRQSEIGPDGHPKRGGFLPPVPLPRRMWAGSQFEFHAPLRVGEAVSRTSTIQSVDSKQGRSGRLVFVKVRHELCRQTPIRNVQKGKCKGGHQQDECDQARLPYPTRTRRAWTSSLLQ